MKSKYTVPFIVVLMFSLVCIALAQTNNAVETLSPPGVDPESSTGLLLLLIPLGVPILVRIAAWTLPKLPTWTLPILAPILGALIDWIGSIAMGTGASPVLSALLGSAGVGLREIQDQVRSHVSGGTKAAAGKVTSFLVLVGLGTTLVSAPVALTGCGGLKPAPIAEGQDSVVVNAERIQRSSLDVYEQVTKWEYANRATLSANVSRAVDRYRKEFPPAWKLSRSALADYKAKRGPDADTVAKLTAALSAAQSALLSLQLGGTDNEVVQANNAITSLINSIRTLLQKQPPIPIAPYPSTNKTTNK